MVHERFTALPCPRKPQTTLALEGCVERSLLRSDAKVNARAARIWNALPAAGRPEFAGGERSWLAYRAASCRAESSKHAGGTFQPVAYGECELARNTTHLRDLAETLRVLSQR